MPLTGGHGKIHHLEIENFKSYKGRQTIGPFKNFTAIIGPNGAGKSNLMDAISFVLGVRSMQLRGNQLKDLIYAFEDSEREARGRKAHVKLVYIAQTGEELSFTRTITGTGSSEYKFNGESVTWDAYNDRMKSIGILIKARNFLVFQGDVESIASKSPKDFTTLFEQISGSDELKREYEQLDQQKVKADEKAALCFQKKRSMAAERKQKKEQKEEAERHLQLQEELKILRSEYILWQLFDIDRDIEQTQAALEVDKGSLEEQLQAQAAAAEEEKEKKKEQASYQKEVLLFEKKMTKKKSDYDKKQPEIVRLREEMKRVQRKLKDSETALEKKGKEKGKQEDLVAKLEKELETQTAMLDEITARNRGEKTLQLAESQLSEYHRIKDEAGSKTSKLKADMETLAIQQKTDEDDLANMESNATALTSREEQLHAAIAKGHEVIQSAVATLESCKVEVAGLQSKRTEMIDGHRKSRARCEAAKKRLDEIEDSLREFRLDRHEMDRDAKNAEAVESMKRLYPGVRGRMTELVRVTQKKYNVPLTVTMGKNMDAVVTDNEKVAKDCIKYLKEQHLSVMTFVPLDNIRVKPISERMRTVGGTAKLLVDVIEYDREIEKALLYACGNTLVCDTLDEARHLAYGDGHYKVVTVEGISISKGGNMTGGTSGGMEARAQRWDNQAIEELKRNRDKLQEEVAEASAVRDMHEKERNLQQEITRVERKITYEEAAMKQADIRLKSEEQELATITSKRRSMEPVMNKLRESMATRGERIHMLQNRINEITDRIYSDFSKSVGVASIREYEENQLKEHEQMTKKKLQLSKQVATLRNQLEYEHRRDTKAPVEKLERTIESDKADLERLKEEGLAVKSNLDLMKKELEEMEKEAQGLRAKADGVEEILQEMKQRNSNFLKNQGKLKRQLTAKETQLDQLQNKRRELLETCELDQIQLPTMPAGDEPAPMDIDLNQPSSSNAAASHSKFDYSRLARKYTQELRPGDKERLDAEFKSKIESLLLEIDKTAPNMKALDQYETLKEKEREASVEFEAARKEAKEMADKFNAVKQHRLDRFIKAFNHISTNINQIYKELTQSTTHPLGGTAYLSLENEDDPFMHGIKYTAMPPTKRFRDMEQLSGGEKTVAALALLFAIHSFRPSPFFVLDEVDAALDNLNVAKVANYIRNKSREEQLSGGNGASGFQGVVISLKDYFYDKADGLVGVYRDCDAGCSKTLTFDLEKFPG
eukprot:TRINITY_DN1284_c0_g1_i1.p1 TRINITY_DN1284_c0_g1~~TRINITY_DN1284_c0_g1_i1.p1  ORF type:complete len:1228 (-),score=375.50 TRINITY_DN1284_c0_g1_i1:655-4338(-)